MRVAPEFAVASSAMSGRLMDRLCPLPPQTISCDDLCVLSCAGVGYGLVTIVVCVSVVFGLVVLPGLVFSLCHSAFALFAPAVAT